MGTVISRRGVNVWPVTMPPLWLAIVLPVAYFLAAYTSTSIFGTDTPIWVSNGFAVTALLRSPRSSWPVLVALAACADYAGLALTGAPILAFAIILCDIFEIASVAWLVDITGASALTASIWATAKLAAICLAVPLIAATGGATIFRLSQGAPFLDVWTTWYCADTCGLITAVPLLLAWSDKRLWRERRPHREVQTLALALVVGLVAAFDFKYHIPGVSLAVPLLLLATFHGGLLGATTASVTIGLAAILETMTGQGFIAHDAGGNMLEKVQNLQIFNIYMLLIAVPVGAVLEQRQRMTVQLQEQQRDVEMAAQAKSDFLAVISHEIRTPLTSVLGVADLLCKDDLSPRQRTYMKQIQSSGRYLLSLINDVLDFSRLEAGKMELEAIDFGMSDVIEQVQSQMAPLATQRHLALHFELGTMPPLRGDPTKIRQVIINLVANAIKFTPQGTVTVSAAWQPTGETTGRCRIDVRDTGIGISMEKQARLFEAFSQVDSSTTRRYGGSGLGLAICKRIVGALNGTIGVESLPGIGSRFWFELPVERGEASALEEPEKPAVTKPQPQRVLLAEDVEVNRELVSEMLGRHGHHVVAVENGEEALAAAMQEDFDLILMDANMPVMDGIEATQRIRNLPPPRGAVPILTLTANVLPEDLERYRRAGVSATVTKPIDWKLLFDAMARYGRNGKAAAPREAAPRQAALTAAAQPPSALRPATPQPAAPQAELSSAGEELRKRLGQLDDGTGAVTRRLVDIFIRDTQQRLVDLAEMLAKADASGIVQRAHAIRGSAANLGLQRLAALCGEIETAARAADLGIVPERLDDAEQEFARIRDVLVQLQAKSPSCAS